jgi:hypothetical protein
VVETYAALIDPKPTARNMDLAVRYSSEIVRQDDIDSLALLFPALFPYGLPKKIDRPVKLSLEGLVRHLLKLSSRRFSNDRYFALTCFDIIGKSKVAQLARTYVSAKSVDSSKLVNVNPAQLKSVMDFHERLKKGSLEQRPIGLENAASLISATSTATSAFPGSNESRSACRRQIFSTSYLMGLAPFFVTLTPSDYRAFAVSRLAGKNEYPPQDERFQIVADNATAAAMYFDHCIRIFNDVVLNYDIKLGGPRKQPGMFGYVQSYYWVVECQGRGTLHAHGLIWALGPWSTLSELESLLNDKISRDGLAGFLNQLITNNIELLPDEILCPDTSCEGNAKDFRFMTSGVEKRTKPGRHDHDPESKLARCLKCSGTFTCTEIYVRSLQAILGDEYKKYFEDKEVQDRFLDTPLEIMPSSEINDIAKKARAYATLKTLLVNKHDFLHRSACFKGGKNQCRFKFPKEPNTRPTYFGPERPKGIMNDEASPAPSQSQVDLGSLIEGNSYFKLIMDVFVLSLI